MSIDVGFWYRRGDEFLTSSVVIDARGADEAGSSGLE
jgi:hypothetical protein